MKAKTIVPLVLGVVVGGAAIKIVVDVVNNAQAATRTDLAQCVVAKVDIDFAEEITPDKLVLKEWPKSSLPAQYFDSLDAVNTRVSGMFIAKDVPVFPSMLAPEGTPPGIQVRIKAGYRAVAVAIDEVTGVSSEVVAVADGAVEIPMAGTKESLNVSVAFGIAAAELARQWNARQHT